MLNLILALIIWTLCLYTFANKKTYNKHLSTKHHSKMKASKIEMENTNLNTSEFKCRTCQNLFFTKVHLKSHLHNKPDHKSLKNQDIKIIQVDDGDDDDDLLNIFCKYVHHQDILLLN